ncbi:MAG: hypothetical protein WD875_12495 [Pirellulales bacterium]
MRRKSSRRTLILASDRRPPPTFSERNGHNRAAQATAAGKSATRSRNLQARCSWGSDAHPRMPMAKKKKK